MSALVVGVDLGGGSARAMAIDADGAVHGSAAAPYPGADAWPAGRADPEGWRAAVDEALQKLGVDAPAALAIGGQSPTTVPAGASGGLAVTCRHPAGVTGSPEEQHGAQRSVLFAEGVREVQQLWDWLLARLGGPVVQTRWPGDPELPGYGPVRETGEAIGEADGSWGVAAGTPLVGGAQDAYLAFWAAGTDVPGRGCDPGGRTGGLAVAVAAGSRLDGLYGLPSAAPGVDIVGGPVSSHGLMLEWVAGVVGRDVPELLERAAEAAPGAGGVVAVPYLEGERAPRWNRDLRAEVVGVGLETTPADLARAVLEGTAYGLAHIAAELAAHAVGIRSVLCGGSPARSELWCRIKASVLGVPVEIPAEPDLAAYGAGLAAGAAVGWWPRPGRGGSGSWPRPATRVVEPVDAWVPVYRDGYRRFVDLGDAAVARLSKEES